MTPGQAPGGVDSAAARASASDEASQQAPRKRWRFKGMATFIDLGLRISRQECRGSRVEGRVPRAPGGLGAIKILGQPTAPFCPEGASDNSPAFQRRVSGPKEQVRPEGTAESNECSQSSLRDEGPFCGLPGVETPGYCQMSLRDKTPEAHARRFYRTRWACHVTLEFRLSNPLAGPSTKPAVLFVAR